VLEEVDFGVGAGARRRLDRQEQRLVGRNLSERKLNITFRKKLSKITKDDLKIKILTKGNDQEIEIRNSKNCS
jgi:hypothetical protein